MSTSNNRTEHGILPESIKSQLRSILPKSNNAGKGGISEGDILCKVRGFVAACRGLPTVQILKLNFPNEIISSESIAGTGNYRYCLRDVTTNGNSSLEDRNGYQIDRLGLMNGHSTESLGSNSSATAVIPDTIQSTTNTSNSKQLDNTNRIASALRGGHKKTSTVTDNNIIVKKEPGISSEVSINNNSSQTVLAKPTSNDACAPTPTKPVEYEHEKDTIETDHHSEAKTTELSEEIKAKILSILPTVGGGVEGVTLTSIKKKAPGFNHISRSLLETNLSDSMIIGSDSDGTKRYYLRAVPRGSDSVSQTAHEAKEHASTPNNTSWKIIPKDPIEANIVQLLREKSNIKLNEVKGLYNTWFKKELLHTGKLKTFLGLISGVKVSKPISNGKGHNEYTITLSKEMLIKVKKPAQKSSTAAVNQKVPVKQARKTADTTTLNNVDAMPVDSDSPKQIGIPIVNTPTEVQAHLLKLTDEQAQTATKFQPGCRVVYDIDKSLQPSSHRIQIRMGVVKSVSINLTTRQFAHEIKVSTGSIMVSENDTLAYAPQSLVYYQPSNKEGAEPATVLNCFFKNNNWQYTILIPSVDGELSTIVHQVTIDQLRYRSKEGDNQSEVERSKKRCHNSDTLNEEGGPAEKRAKA